MIGRVLAFTCLIACSYALIEDLVIENDARSTFHIESFGFEEGGVFKGEIDNFYLLVPHDYVQDNTNAHKFNVALVLQRSDTDHAINAEGGHCFHETFVGPEDWVVPLSDRSVWEKVVFNKNINVAGYYHLYFSNCEKDTHTSFELKTTEYNVAPGTSTKIYLSSGLSSMPSWYFLYSAVFTAMLVAWYKLQKAQWTNVKSIHHLMTSVIVFKILSVFCEAFRFQTMKYEGDHDGWSAAYYIFEFIKGMLMFTAIVLIGTGWSYLKPFLTERDRMLVLAVLVMQGAVNIAMIVVDESTPGSYAGMRWADILHVLDVVCCCAILFPIIWSIRHLRAASGSDSKALRNANRLNNFRTFYLLVVAYVYFTRIINYLLKTLLPYDLTYLGPVFDEFASVVFYAYTGYLFRPQEQNPYLAIGKDDDDVQMTDLENL